MINLHQIGEISAISYTKKTMETRAKILEIFGEAIGPIRLSVWFSPHDLIDFQCLYSDGPESYQNEKRSLYDMDALVRILGKKNKIFEEKTELELYQDKKDILGHVLQWSDHSKKYIELDLKNTTQLDNEKLIEIFQTKKQEIHEIYQEIYYKNYNK